MGVDSVTMRADADCSAANCTSMVAMTFPARTTSKRSPTVTPAAVPALM
jgi:hypothetical protein